MHYFYEVSLQCKLGSCQKILFSLNREKFGKTANWEDVLKITGFSLNCRDFSRIKATRGSHFPKALSSSSLWEQFTEGV